MGLTKYQIHSVEHIALAQLFKAMAHPARIAIVENLLSHESLSCKDLQNLIPLAQSTISSHMKELHSVGILETVVIGNQTFYQVCRTPLEKMINHLDKVIYKIETVNKGQLITYRKSLQNILSNKLSNTA